MAYGINPKTWQRVYAALRQQGLPDAEARQKATQIVSQGAAPPDPTFGSAPESRLDGAPQGPLVVEPEAGPKQGPVHRRSRADWAVDASMAGDPYSPGENVDSMDVTDRPSEGEVGRAKTRLYHRDRDLAERGMGPMPVDELEPEAQTRDRYDRKYGPGRYEADAPGRARRGGVAPTGGGPLAERQRQLMEDDKKMFADYDARVAERRAQAGQPAPQSPMTANGVGTNRLPVGGVATTNDGQREWDGWQPGMPLPGVQSNAQKVLAERAAIEAQIAAERNANIGAKYGPQAQGIAEAGDARGVSDFAAVQSPHERQMNTYRKAIEKSARFDEDTQRRANSRETLRELDASRAQTNKDFRAKVAAAPKSPADPRMQLWKAQSMLAGGQPTGGPRGTKAATNALMMMSDPNLTDEQRSSLRYMLPGGQLAAGVDAHQLETAARLAQGAVTGALAGTAAGPAAQAAAEAAQIQNQTAKDEARQKDEDVLGEKYAPSGYFGYDELTVAEQQQMYDDLVKQGYTPAEAQRAVDRQANKRRATDRHRWNQ
jgi:hypothetical protein